tara:strand:- start:30 stop:206 length:177 start_codon:yes stop_codon:yes gene_type:complete
MFMLSPPVFNALIGLTNVAEVWQEMLWIGRTFIRNPVDIPFVHHQSPANTQFACNSVG